MNQAFETPRWFIHWQWLHPARLAAEVRAFAMPLQEPIDPATGQPGDGWIWACNARRTGDTFVISLVQSFTWPAPDGSRTPMTPEERLRLSVDLLGTVHALGARGVTYSEMRGCLIPRRMVARHVHDLREVTPPLARGGPDIT